MAWRTGEGRYAGWILLCSVALGRNNAQRSPAGALLQYSLRLPHLRSISVKRSRPCLATFTAPPFSP